MVDMVQKNVRTPTNLTNPQHIHWYLGNLSGTVLKNVDFSKLRKESPRAIDLPIIESVYADCGVHCKSSDAYWPLQYDRDQCFVMQGFICANFQETDKLDKSWELD